MDEERIKTILSIFYDAGKNPSQARFKEMFDYYWQELNTTGIKPKVKHGK